jgi:hypothetical protein
MPESLRMLLFEIPSPLRSSRLAGDTVIWLSVPKVPFEMEEGHP